MTLEDIDTMEMDVEIDIALSEYSEVSYTHRLLRNGDSSYFEWIENCTDIDKLKVFVKNMRIVIDPRGIKTTRVNVLIMITRLIFGITVGAAISLSLGAALAAHSSLHSTLIRVGSSIIGGLAGEELIRIVTENDFSRFSPMIKAAESRIKELESL